MHTLRCHGLEFRQHGARRVRAPSPSAKHTDNKGRLVARRHPAMPDSDV
jgi:hypothetical protein